MSEKLPCLIDPILLAERRVMLAGTIKISELERLSDVVVADSHGDIDVEMAFGREGKQAVMSGRIKTELTLECQTCLQSLSYPLDIAFKLGVVSSLEEADRLEIDCEPLLFNGEKLALKSVVEDEILLALPDYPKHEYACSSYTGSGCDERQPNNHGRMDNPFSVLAKLKKSGD